MEEQDKQEEHFQGIARVRNELYEDLGDASDEKMPRGGRFKHLIERMYGRIGRGENSAGIEGARRAFYNFFDIINAQYERNVFRANPRNRKAKFDNLPKEQKAILYKLVDWQGDFADFFTAHAGFASDARIHNEFNEAIEDMIFDAPTYLQTFHNVSFSKAQIEEIVRPLVQGAKSAGAGINLLRQITDQWEFKWGEKNDDIKKKIDAVAYEDGVPICTVQFKGVLTGNTRIQHAIEYRRATRNPEAKKEALEFLMGTKKIFPGAVPIYVIVGFNDQNMDRDTAIVHFTKYGFLESQLNESLDR